MYKPGRLNLFAAWLMLVTFLCIGVWLSFYSYDEYISNHGVAATVYSFAFAFIVYLSSYFVFLNIKKYFLFTYFFRSNLLYRKFFTYEELVNFSEVAEVHFQSTKIEIKFKNKKSLGIDHHYERYHELKGRISRIWNKEIQSRD